MSFKALFLMITRRRTKVHFTVDFVAPYGITSDRITELMNDAAEKTGVTITDLRFATTREP